MPVDLSRYNNAAFDRGAPRWKEALWLLAGALFFQHSLAVWNGAKIWLLRRFGAVIGRGVLLKPRVTIKFPWKLVIGDHVWIGEGVWIDNLAEVSIGSHVCVSQGAMLLTGNHDHASPTFDLIVHSIRLEDGAWVGAKALVCPGVAVHAGAILTAGSVATGDLEEYGIYQGNPATFKRRRKVVFPPGGGI
ncbi:MAG: colanic acid biosynthesis acetyltransferase WcaF [Lewinellaceae bacterium]|nr:colanic acid biosynthesis acetyltransferase WcaF [Lewinellaceae bacterium]